MIFWWPPFPQTQPSPVRSPQAISIFYFVRLTEGVSRRLQHKPWLGHCQAVHVSLGELLSLPCITFFLQARPSAQDFKASVSGFLNSVKEVGLYHFTHEDTGVQDHRRTRPRPQDQQVDRWKPQRGSAHPDSLLCLGSREPQFCSSIKWRGWDDCLASSFVLWLDSQSWLRQVSNYLRDLASAKS